MHRAFVFITVLLLGTFAQADPLPPAAHAEVAVLLKTLADSECEFYRNGSWYTGPKAASHLQRKLEYLERKGLVSSAEEFIQLGASKSSASGKIYQVRCPGEAAVPSAEWLGRQLEQARASEDSRL